MKIKKLLLFVIPVLVISYIVLWPSFRLHLTGDDYLGLWRYHYYLDGHAAGKWNNFNYFLTDYGPQDTFTEIIHNFFGFQPTYYYFFSYLLRLLAAFSFFPIILQLTKNKKAAYISILFFVTITAGLETTDWSFNMPSYLAIAFLNTFLFVYIKSHLKKSYKLFFLSAILLYVTLLAQPIRMTFLPGALIVFELYSLIRNRNWKTSRSALMHIAVFATLLVIFYVTGFVGNSIGAGETLAERLNGGWRKVFASNFSTLYPVLQQGQYSTLTYPISIFGSLIFPSNLIPVGYQILTPLKTFLKIVIPLYLLFWIFIRFSSSKVLIIIAALWSILIFVIFGLMYPNIINKSQFISLIVGGYAIIFLLVLFIRKYKDPQIAMGIVLGILLCFLSFAAPWLRNPTFLYETMGRYLIVPAAGLTILLGVVIGSARSFRSKVLVYGISSLLILINMFTSFSFLYHLSTVREIHETDTIRHGIPYVKNFNDQNKPLMFYFEPQNSETLHHALLFGFPVIMGFQYNFFNVWHLAYTDNWDEVVAAYKDGSSLKRFSIPVKKVPITDIYSFRLDGDHLVNTTKETRQKLQGK